MNTENRNRNKTKNPFNRADNTGALWCYVDSRSPCLDKQRSVRWVGHPTTWSLVCFQASHSPGFIMMTMAMMGTMAMMAITLQVQPVRARLELPGLLHTSPPQRPVQWIGFRQLPARGEVQHFVFTCLWSVSNSLLQVICKGSRCSPVGGSYPSSSGQFGSGSYGTSGTFGTSGSYQTGSIANCRHGQSCNVGSSGTFGSSSGGYGSTSSGSIANCRFGQPGCNVGYNTGSSSGSFNNFGSSGQQYNPYGSNGQQVSFRAILWRHHICSFYLQLQGQYYDMQQNLHHKWGY